MNVKRFAPLPMWTTAALFSLGLASALGGCGDSGSGTSLNDAPIAREAGTTFQEFGDYIVHYNAVTSDVLSPEDAAKYGITRSRSNALLNVVLLKKSGEPGHQPVSGNVAAKATNLTGQLKKVTLREITEGDAIYYIGVIPVANNETLNFEIIATPEDSGQDLTVKFQQQFFTGREFLQLN